MAQCAARNNAEASRIPAPLSWGQRVSLGPGRVTNLKRSYPGTAVVRASQAQILPAGLINVAEDEPAAAPAALVNEAASSDPGAWR